MEMRTRISRIFCEMPTLAADNCDLFDISTLGVQGALQVAPADVTGLGRCDRKRTQAQRKRKKSKRKTILSLSELPFSHRSNDRTERSHGDLIATLLFLTTTLN